ncbi:MAG: hypothetical protein O2866_01025 [archaeon]|nr:hypothetical protein [archaeon]MDA1167449.1 hypothetical protein [archaeon]
MQPADPNTFSPATVDMSQQMNMNQGMVATPMVVAAPNAGGSKVNIMDFSSAMSVFKYGLIAIGGWIVSGIVLTVVWIMAVLVGLSSDNNIVGLILILGAAMTTIIAYGQMIIYPVGKALKDARSSASSFSYADSWKAAISSFLETVALTVMMAIGLAVGISMEITVLSLLSGIGFMLFMIGYIPYLARKTAQFVN